MKFVLGEIDWLVKDDATAEDFAAFRHRVEKPPVGRLYQTNLEEVVLSQKHD